MVSVDLLQNDCTPTFWIRNKGANIYIYIFSSWQDILSGIPYGSILGPLLFNEFICNLFLIINNIDLASYTDDSTPYTTDESAEKL